MKRDAFDLFPDIALAAILTCITVIVVFGTARIATWIALDIHADFVEVP